MTIRRDLNRAGFGGNYAVWYLLKQLEAAGWTILSSGSGVTGIYEPSGDVFHPTDNPKTNSSATQIGVGSGQEHFGNEGCWVRIEDPDSNRELLFQRHASSGDSYDGYWYIGYSRAAKFVSGSPDADTPPDASDEQMVSETGSKGAPGSYFEAGTTNTLLQVAADDVASPDGEYGFLLLELIATNTIATVFGLDDLRNVATGDPHPLAFITNTTGGPLDYLQVYGQGFAKTWVDVGGGGEAWEDCGYYWPSRSASAFYHNEAGASKYDNKERPFPLPCIEENVGGYLGASRWLRAAAVGRDYPETGNSKTLLYAGDCIIVDLWDGATTPSTI